LKEPSELSELGLLQFEAFRPFREAVFDCMAFRSQLSYSIELFCGFLEGFGVPVDPIGLALTPESYQG
jgi:hypothetical protein